MEFASLPRLRFLFKSKNRFGARLVSFTLLFLLSGCGEGTTGVRIGIDVPEDEFAQEYALSDFKLNQSYDYLELRAEFINTDEPDHLLLESYDAEAKALLDDTQLELLSVIESQTGFKAGCRPSYCPFYAVTLRDYTIDVIDSENELLALLDGINTEAEVYVWLVYTEQYHEGTKEPLALYEIEGGYRVLLDWDTGCGLRGQDVIDVFTDGGIEKVLEIKRQNYNACW